MMNQIILQGRLTADPERKETGGGVEYATFSLAVKRERKNANGDRETDFVDCIAWRGTAEFISKYFKRGQQILLKGTLQSDSWTDQEGRKRKSWAVHVEDAYFCDSGPRLEPGFENSFGAAEIPAPFDDLPY